MTAATLNPPRLPTWRRIAALAGLFLAATVTVMKTNARPAVNHLKIHAYGIIGLAFIDAAAFVHSSFTGLLVTGVSFLVFEWKVSE